MAAGVYICGRSDRGSSRSPTAAPGNRSLLAYREGAPTSCETWAGQPARRPMAIPLWDSFTRTPGSPRPPSFARVLECGAKPEGGGARLCRRGEVSGNRRFTGGKTGAPGGETRRWPPQSGDGGLPGGAAVARRLPLGAPGVLHGDRWLRPRCRRDRRVPPGFQAAPGPPASRGPLRVPDTSRDDGRPTVWCEGLADDGTNGAHTIPLHKALAWVESIP
jgi:hypothetical protein